MSIYVSAVTTTVIVAALGAAAVALVVVLALLWTRRSSRAQDDRIAAAVSDVNQRVEATLHELSAALERAEEELEVRRLLRLLPHGSGLG